MDLALRFGRLAFSLGAYFSWLDPAPLDTGRPPYSAQAPAPQDAAPSPEDAAYPVGFQPRPSSPEAPS